MFLAKAAAFGLKDMAVVGSTPRLRSAGTFTEAQIGTDDIAGLLDELIMRPDHCACEPYEAEETGTSLSYREILYLDGGASLAS
jgi:hypothetical protein